MNYLLLDLGNSSLHLATCIDGKVGPVRRVGYDVGTWHCAVRDVWATVPGDDKLAVAASVIPRELKAVKQHLKELDIPVKVIREDLPLPMELAIGNPGTVGVDRVCAAAAAYDVIRAETVVAQFGTAITIDCVSRSGVFLGGTILPGLEMSAAALHHGTAQLPKVDPVQPTDVFGRNTEQAICSGIFYGAIGALREITERFATSLNSWPTLVVTGGSAPLIVEVCDFIDRHVPDLTLRGIALAARQPSTEDSKYPK